MGRRSVLELGCGTGLVSLVAATQGAHAAATDISPLVLSFFLCRRGWQETSCDASGGTLETTIFDVTSPSTLPIHRTELSLIDVASTMTYDANLAEILAKRVVVTCRLGAWAIVGDDDAGNRGAGRERFEAELLQHLQLDDIHWVYLTVKCKDYSQMHAAWMGSKTHWDPSAE
jgi:SAM-dependent methyltransferase